MGAFTNDVYSNLRWVPNTGWGVGAVLALAKKFDQNRSLTQNLIKS